VIIRLIHSITSSCIFSTMISTVMKQNKDSRLPPQIRSATAAAISQAERIHQLGKQGKNAIMNTNDKRTFFLRTLELKAEIMGHAHDMDSCDPTKNLVASLRLILPENTTAVKSVWKRNELSTRFLQLQEPFLYMAKCIREQNSIEAANRSNTRQYLSNQCHEEANGVLAIFDQVIDVVRRIDQEVIHERTKKLYEKVSKVNLTLAQRERRWSADRVPLNTNEQVCPMCRHKTLNYPIENDGIDTQNRENLVKYEKQQIEWDAYKNEISKGNQPSTKPTRPAKRIFKELIVQCMCAVSFCVSIRDDNTNHCPISCINCDNQQRYPFTGVPFETCSCPICMCQCQFACTVEDLPALLWSTTLANSAAVPNFDDNSQHQQQLTSSSPVTTLFKNAVGDGVQLGMTWMKDELVKQQQQSSSSSASFSTGVKDTIQQRSQSLICEQAAVNIASRSKNVSTRERLQLQRELGPPETNVILPGATFNTRSLMASGQHARNNRLPVSTQGQPIAGMRSNLKIDFSTVSDEYKRACNEVLHFNPNTNNGMTSSAVGSGGAGGELLDLTIEDGEGSTNSYLTIAGTTSVNMDVAKKGDKSNNDAGDEAVLKMHERILSRLRDQMTVVAEDRLQNGKSPENKKKRKRLLENLKFIEKSERDGTHLNNIKAVTSGGKTLNGENALCSQDVIDRVEILNDDDSEEE
jgi:hypothetical protein